METWVLFCSIGYLFSVLLILSETCIAAVRETGQIYPGFQGAQVNWIDNDGLFLLSNDSNYAFGFTPTQDVTLFLLVVVHMSSSRIIWSANRGSLIQNTDKFVFHKNGNVYLESGGSKVRPPYEVWSTDTAEKGVTSMELQDSGNLVLIGKNHSPIWQSFSYPTDTLLSGQEFIGGMRLVGNSDSGNMNYYLEIDSGDLLLSAGFSNPQPYWSIKRDAGSYPDSINKVSGDINKVRGDVYSASLVSNSLMFFDQNKFQVWQLPFAEPNLNVTWAAVLGSDGLISFYNLQDERSFIAEEMKIPEDSCSSPEPCGPYYVCSIDNPCQCPAVLSSFPNCNPRFGSSCNNSEGPMELKKLGDELHYFALRFVHPVSKSDLNNCKDACLQNCSCHVLFFQTNSGNCFMFDQIGSLQLSKEGSSEYVSYIKILNDSYHGSDSGGLGSNSEQKPSLSMIIIPPIVVLPIVAGLLYMGLRYHRRKNTSPDPTQEDSSDNDDFLESLAGMPVRFSYRELDEATNNFSVKLGQGGFGTVYRGTLKDGTEIAVKKLEGVGQGTKEFRAEVCIIGSIHHVHLVKLKGFCAEGTHRLLAYEYMAKGSLERWIFKKNNENYPLDWDTRFNIALGTAKGLAYLHDDCDSKIIHCDIKPENVLLDDNYVAKVSDFGLAKLMTREQSQVFTALRGTRGYLAPEWITNHRISEKSDVYSFGMVLLEIIAGRKNFDRLEKSEKAYLPSFAFKMAEEEKFEEILDPQLTIDKEDKEDERVINAIKVALWCIQGDMHLRPSMSKIVKMLEGSCIVPHPPTYSHMAPHIYSSVIKSISGAYLSEVTLSGPR